MLVVWKMLNSIGKRMDFPKFIANCRRVVEKTAHFIENWQRLPKQDQIGQETRKKKDSAIGKQPSRTNSKAVAIRQAENHGRKKIKGTNVALVAFLVFLRADPACYSQR